MLTTNYVHKMDYHLSDRNWNENENGRSGTARVATDKAQMTGQLCNYIEARTAALRGSINCRNWPGHDKN